MYSLSDLRKGLLIKIEDEPYRIVESRHKSLGRGGAVVNTKLKHLISGAQIGTTFKGNDKVEPAEVEQADMQFLYRKGEGYVFMDTVTYEQTAIPAAVLADEAPFLKEGQEVVVQYFQERPIGVDLPPKVDLKVTETAAGAKGDTATSAQKEAILETGLSVQVPLFIKEGDTVRVDTRSGEYAERV